MARLHRITLALLATLVGSTAARAQGAPAAAPLPDYYRADSVVLERAPGYSVGPAYRLAITRAGAVHYDARRGAPDRSPTAPLAPSAFGILMAHATASAFAQLPDSIMADRRFCPYLTTDGATLTVVLYLPERAKRVVDYQGCQWAPAALRRFEDAIERAAGVNSDGRPR
jgi:hypothetical protein